MVRRGVRPALCLLVAWLMACDDSPPPSSADIGPDALTDATARPDSTPGDRARPDDPPRDARLPDLGVGDALASDILSPDAMPLDAMPPDAMPPDIMPLDAIPPDAMPPDAIPPDAGCAIDPEPPWTRGRTATGGVVTFTELMVDPRGDADLEWIELYNLLAIPVDLSGWRLDDAIRFTVPPDTFLDGGARMVIARDPARLAQVAPDVAALGPYDGRLSRGGERLDLFDASGRRMDSVRWWAGPPWPTPPEDAGLSLVKRDPRASSELAEHWTSSPAVGGTPGAPEIVLDPVEPATAVLIAPDAPWAYTDADPGPGWQAPAFDDGPWAQVELPLFGGAPPRGVGSARFTADNHFAVYLGASDGDGLRAIGRDREGDWTSPEAWPLDIAPGDHLFVAAWEDPGDDRSPQMLIGAHTVDDGPPIGTTAARYEVVLGPAGVHPGPGLASPAPAPAALAALIEDSDAQGTWRAPAADRARDQPPWSGALRDAFEGDARYLWFDTFEPASASNVDETFVLFRSRAPLLGPAGRTRVEPRPQLWLRADFAFDEAGDRADLTLILDLLADDGAVVWLNGREVHRQNVAPGPIDPDTRAVVATDPLTSSAIALPAAALVDGVNTVAVALFQAPDPDDDLRFAASLRATRRAPLRLDAPPSPAGPVVISEIMYHPRRAPDPMAPAPAEWIELHNPGPAPVDLSGWRLVDAVGFVFPDGSMLAPDGRMVLTDDPDAFSADWPAVPAVGPWIGGLSNRGARVRLLDSCGAVVDDVRFHDGGRWPGEADGAGPSLELRDPRADNASPDTWAPSDERHQTRWQQISYRGIAEPSAVGPDGQWHELVLGLLDAGVVLIDDVSVIADPDGVARELIDDGGFDGGHADRWRLLGTHRHSAVVDDPDEPGNPVLRLVATGATEHMHNHAETTLRDGATIEDGVTYAISMRARWVAGSAQLNSRLYFNRLARTTRLETPPRGGTPGAPNRVAAEPQGPTFTDGGHAPPVPDPDQPIRVGVVVDDPDGIEAVDLWWSRDGGPFGSVPMVRTVDGRYEASLPGQPAGALLHIYAEAVDGVGHRAWWPAGGPAGRALIAVDAGEADAAAPGLPTVRLLMTADDTARLFDPTALMSNDRLGATVIDDDARVFYDVGVRAKGSQRGRPTDARFGYALRFDPAEPFRGVYPTVSLDRSEGVRFGQRELLIDIALVAAGAPSGEYNDLAHLVAPRGAHTGPVTLQLARFGDLLLDNRFESGGDGMLFEYELVYFPLTTDDGTPTGRKRPQPDRVVGTALRVLGEDPEAYRHVFLIKNNRRRDDYAGIIAFAQAFGLPDAEFDAHVGDVIDVDQWLRAFALSTLSGAIDHYANGARHNVQFYVRPADDRVLYFPHDLDFYPGDPRQAVIANRDLRRLIRDPDRRRRFYGHLRQIIETVYNDAYMGRWRDAIGALLPDQDFAGHHAFLVDRARYVMDEAPDGVMNAVPPVPFAVTRPAPGAEVPPGPLTVEGTGWLDVDVIRPVGSVDPLAVTWIAAETWQVQVDVGPGVQALRFEALDASGAAIGVADVPISIVPDP